MASHDAEEEEEVIHVGGLNIAGWEDVTSEEAEQELPPVVAVQYDANDRATMNLFTAVLKSGEVSERVYNLTTDVSTPPHQRTACNLACDHAPFTAALPAGPPAVMHRVTGAST